MATGRWGVLWDKNKKPLYIYYGSHQQQLEYDFVLSPGADPKLIRLGFDGIERLSLDADGNLWLETHSGAVCQRRPVIYQVVDGQQRDIQGRFVLVAGAEVALQVDSYDPTFPLVIDPVVLNYSTFLGGSADEIGQAISVDTDGNIYVAGGTRSTDFPQALAIPGPSGRGGFDVFVAKLSASGSELLYATIIGGTGEDTGYGLALGADRSVYVTGETSSKNFPVVGAVQAAYAGEGDAFVLRLSAQGDDLLFSTYLGGKDWDSGTAVATDLKGDAHVTGWTKSDDFTTLNALQPGFGGMWDAFVAKFGPDGVLRHSTFLGGATLDQGLAIEPDPSGNVYVAGITGSDDFPVLNAFQSRLSGYTYDAFLTKMKGDGSDLIYSTYIGGSNRDVINGVAVDAQGTVYIAGGTESPNFPVNARALDTSCGTDGQCNPQAFWGADAFVGRFDAYGNRVFLTYLGGSDFDEAADVAVDISGDAYVVGYTGSRDFPMRRPFDDRCDNCASYDRDAFVAKINWAGTALIYSSYIGGGDTDQGLGIAVSRPGVAHVTGFATSPDFPLVNPLQGGDGFQYVAESFVARILDSPELPDLVVSSLIARGAMIAGRLVDFAYQVKNSGSSAAVAGYSNGVYVDNRRVASHPGATLNPGETGGGSFRWRATCGIHRIEVRADDDRRLNESNENNNSRVLTVGVKCLPSVEATPLQ